MNDTALTAMREAVQTDPGGRGLAAVPGDNLFTARPDDFAAACRSIADEPRPALGVVTGFFIAHADPPCGETDGPPGALFLARALTPLGVKVTLITDPFCRQALEVGLNACGLQDRVPVYALPPTGEEIQRHAVIERGSLTHLIAVERPGPGDDGRCRNMRGRDITAETAPAHLLFEAAGQESSVRTIGIGDGGNEIGMGKIPVDVIRRNIPGGGQIACRVATDYLIVAGISNWGAYALASGVRYLRGVPHDPALYDPARELEILERMVERGPLVDGVAGKFRATVDGLSFEEYAKPLTRLGEILRG